jgi:hypothetical protein
VNVLPRASETFVRVPCRLPELLRRHELSRDGFAILVFLLFRADPVTREYAATLGTLADELNWGKSNDTLLRQLKKLRDAGLIVFPPTRQGQQLPHVFRLTGADIATSAPASASASASASALTPPPVRKLTSAVRKCEEPRNAIAKPVSESAELPRAEVEPPLDKRREEKNDDGSATTTTKERKNDLVRLVTPDLASTRAQSQEQALTEKPGTASEDDDLAGKLERLGPTSAQRRRWLENPGLTRAWLDVLEKASGNIRSPAGFLDSKVTTGALPAGAPSKPKEAMTVPLFDCLSIWVRNEGRFYPVEAVLDEIDKRERMKRERLSEADREALLAQWSQSSHEVAVAL